MARNTIIDPDSGFLAVPPDFNPREGITTEDAIVALSSAVQALTRKINGGIDLGMGNDSERAGNLSAQYIEIVFPGSANVERVIPHGLGRVPAGYLMVRCDRAVSLYDSNINSWSEDKLYLKADVASATVKLLVF